jgi:phosphoserine phosphatase RsbU/P
MAIDLNDPKILMVVVSALGLAIGLWKISQRLQVQDASLQQAQDALSESQNQLQQILAVKEQMDHELEMGHHIQMNMLTLTLPAFPKHKDLDLYAILNPCREVGGDFYDFYFFRGNMSYLFEANRLCFCVGDVSGKGVPAALFMPVIKILLQSQANECLSPAKILTHVNQVISADNPWCMFVTLFFGILNLTDGELVYTNAGHNPPYLQRRDGSLEPLNQRHGPPLGIVEGLVYRESRTVLQTNDLLVVYTDGVTEAMDVQQNLFSEQRLETVLQSQSFESAVVAVETIAQAVQEFQGDADQSDDLTLLSLLFRGNPTLNPDDLLEFSVNQEALLQFRNT